MWVSPANFGSVAAFLTGFDVALEGGFLKGFREWLIVRADGCNNLVWPGIVAYVIYPHGEDPIATLHESESNDEFAQGTASPLQRVSCRFDQHRIAWHLSRIREMAANSVLVRRRFSPVLAVTDITDLPQSRGIHAAGAFVLGATCVPLLKSSLVQRRPLRSRRRHVIFPLYGEYQVR